MHLHTSLAAAYVGSEQHLTTSGDKKKKKRQRLRLCRDGESNNCCVARVVTETQHISDIMQLENADVQTDFLTAFPQYVRDGTE